MDQTQAKQAIATLQAMSEVGSAVGQYEGGQPQRQTAVGYLDFQIKRLEERLAQRQHLRRLAETANEEQQQAILDLVFNEREWRI